VHASFSCTLLTTIDSGGHSVLKKYRCTRYLYFLKKYRALYTVLGTVLFKKKKLLFQL